MNQQGQRPTPPVTPQLLEAARRSPGQNLLRVDPMYDPRKDFPPYAIEGYWRVDERGQLIEFVHNEQYRPSPKALGLPAPTDAVDAAMQLAAAGHGPHALVPAALADATVWTLLTETGGIYLVEDRRGPLVAVYTAQEHLPRGLDRWGQVAVAELVRLVPPGCDLSVNPWSRVTMRVPVRDVIQARTARQG